MNCKTKNIIKIILDVILIILTLTLFNKSFISMKYHEITGLVVIGIMLVHIGINIRTAKAMCVKFTHLPAALKVCIITDLLLLINFLWFGISGVLCSKTILTSISSNNSVFKLYHMAAGAAALVLLGIHIGLHICRKHIPKKLMIIITVIFVAAGAYSVVNSSFIRWASIPFNTLTSQQSSHTGGMRGESNSFREQRESDMPIDNAENHSGTGVRSENAEYSREHSEAGAPNETARESREQGNSAADKSKNIAMYFSIIAAFSMITCVIAAPKKKNPSCINS